MVNRRFLISAVAGVFWLIGSQVIKIIAPKVIKDIKLDAINTINKSHKVTKKEVKYGIFKDLWQSILRIFAPLF